MLDCSVSHLYDLFESDHLPRLRYITKQELHPSSLIRPMHSHEEVSEILLIYNGTGVYRSGARSYTVKEGDLIFSNPIIPHEMTFALNNAVGVYCFGFADFKRPGLRDNFILPETEHFIRPAGKYFSALTALADILFLGIGNKNEDVFPSLSLTFSNFLSMALTIPSHVSKYSPDLIEYNIAEQVQKYIDTHYVEDFTLEDIAAEFNCSAPYISHVFKDVIGYSPMQYKTRCRIGLAQTFLLSSDMTSTQVATMVGYDNTNYFNTVFTKMVGISPIRYRKQYMTELRGICKQ